MIDKYIKMLRKKGHRAFSLDQMVGDLSISRNMARVLVCKSAQSGDIISPLRGFYVIVPYENQNFGSIPADELVPIIMNYIHAQYYVGLLSGAAFYGASHQKPARFQVVSNKRIKHSLKFGQVEIELIFKKKIDHLPIKMVSVKTGYLHVATAELTVFDLFKFPSRSGGLNHIATVLSELVSHIDFDKLVQLAEELNEKTWLQRMGYILDRLDSMDQEKVITLSQQTASYIGGQSLPFVRLAPEISGSEYPRIDKWKIIENTQIESDL
jgi:predicted transcriptional regulator of viral defense system